MNDPINNGSNTSPSADIANSNFDNIVQQDISAFSEPTLDLGDQTKAYNLGDMARGPTRSTVAVSELSNFKLQFETWKNKYDENSASANVSEPTEPDQKNEM